VFYMNNICSVQLLNCIVIENSQFISASCISSYMFRLIYRAIFRLVFRVFRKICKIPHLNFILIIYFISNYHEYFSYYL